MRTFIPLVAAFIACLAAEPALCADWTGVYAGATIGRRTTEATWETTCLQASSIFGTCPDSSGIFATVFNTDNPAELKDRDGRYGGFAGAQIQLGIFVFGVEGDIADADTAIKRGGIPGTEDPAGDGRFGPDSVSVRSEWDASARGRVGILISPTMLLFATAGASWLKLDAAVHCGAEFPVGWCSIENVGRTESFSEVLRGTAYGGGFETLIGEHILFRGEYRRSEYGDLDARAFDGVIGNADAIDFSVTPKTDTFSLSLAYKF